MNRYDESAKQIGFLVGISGEIYLLSIGRASSVFLEKMNDEWIGWRESFDINSGQSKSSKVITKANTFDYALLEIQRYLKFINERGTK